MKATIKNSLAAPLIAVGIIGLIESALQLSLGESAMKRSLDLRLKTLASQPAPTIQIMGDSSADKVKPSGVARTLSGEQSVGNYSFPGISPLFLPCLLERQIAAGNRPDAIVYMPMAASLNQPQIDRFVGRFAGFKEVMNAIGDGASWDAVTFGYICKFSHSNRYRDEWRSLLTEGNPRAIQTFSDPASDFSPIARRPVQPPTPASDTGMIFNRSTLTPSVRSPLEVQKSVENSLLRLSKICDQHGILLFWATLPVYQSLYDEQSDNGTLETLIEFTRELESRSSWIILKAIPPVYPDHHFLDPVHISPAAGDEYGSNVGEMLNANGKFRTQILGLE